jgi:hypothetical protein
VRHDATVVHGEPTTHDVRRMAAQRRAHRQVQGRGTMQERARLWFISRWVGDGVIAGLTKKAVRCRRSRRCSTPCSLPAPLRRGERSSLPPSTRAAPGLGAPAASQALASPSPLLLFFPHSPYPSPLTTVHPRWGKPKCGSIARGTRHRGKVGARSRCCARAKSRGAPGLVARASLAMWPAPNGRHRACRVTGRGNRGISP